MKGIIGMVRCDHEGCPNGFVDEQLRTGHADSAGAANDAERKAVAEGWSLDARGKVRHYCPGHTQERRLEEERRKDAFEKAAVKAAENI
jgi:hypothetical protein